MTGLPPAQSNGKGLASLAGAAWHGVAGLLRRFGRDRSGVGAVEFALIAPLLLILYITAFEVTVGLSVAKRATRTAGAVADLTTQADTVDTTSLATMKDVATAIFAPYSATSLSLQVTGIAVDAAGKATVKWSWAQNGTAPYKKNATFALPSTIATPSSFLVHTRVSIPHKLMMFMPGLLPPQIDNITISREYYFRLRLADAVSCSDCPSG